MASSQPVAPGRHSRGLSFKSDRSQQSSSSSKKIQISESAEEKHRRQLHSKADPSVAMNEAQPNLVALEQSTLGSLRTMQHKDQYGNIITDPDLSNPTRPRFERPLETIRSFEAAIYGTYSSRPASYVRTESTPATPGPDHSRRGSYFGAPNGHSNRGHYDQGGHYNGRGAYSRPDSYVENGNGNGHPENYYPYNQGGGGRPRPRHHARMNTDQSGYSQHGYHKSYDNMTAASGSGSGSNTDAYGNSTDPSSVNSSIDQLQQQQQQQQQQIAESYGFQGFGGGPNLDNQAGAGGRINFGSKPPAADPNAGGPVGGGAAAANRRHLRKATNDSEMSNNTKRKSWFKRRFSKD
ncbi:hypothetical protein ASPCADRAFT_204070 [Aspergillus carbonarius ITEM 5010]|uniref:Uncharacterized protein n=1 Tax=Aspergillus carbonarius (strain ITEM 5010) TaxID=602072 RepID=A0A1R3S0F1_ASPC5|nr:hypothetical protein ASPCADRAFT_204070 [Aspergillus carbonarius ITEM 5010]